MQLADFAGRWEMRRAIADHRAGCAGRLSGVTAFMADPQGGLVCHEAGWLRLGAGAPMAATRGYLWRAAPAGGIEVRFVDGRFFHRFDAAETRPEATHDCAPDLYRVRYDFSRWPRWRTQWWVRGPRKDYHMATFYRPAGQATGTAASTVRTG